MPPSLAIVSLLPWWSVARARMAAAHWSLVSSEPSRIRVHSGAIAPVRAIALWFSVWFCARLASAPAAFACIWDEGEPSIPTSG